MSQQCQKSKSYEDIIHSQNTQHNEKSAQRDVNTAAEPKICAQPQTSFPGPRTAKI